MNSDGKNHTRLNLIYLKSYWYVSSTKATAQSDPGSPVAWWTAINSAVIMQDRQFVYQIGRRGLREGQSSGDDEDMILLLTDTNLQVLKHTNKQLFFLSWSS